MNKLSIEETITHARNIAKEQRYYANFEKGMTYSICINTAENNEQIAEWLEELKTYKQGNCTNDCSHFDNAVQYGYNKAIERLEKFCEEECYGICPECEVQSAIKHLKAGGSDD